MHAIGRDRRGVETEPAQVDHVVEVALTPGEARHQYGATSKHCRAFRVGVK
jgi:hypothetical protein